MIVNEENYLLSDFYSILFIYGWIMLSFTEIGIWGIIISAGFLGGFLVFYLESILKNEKNFFLLLIIPIIKYGGK